MANIGPSAQKVRKAAEHQRELREKDGEFGPRPNVSPNPTGQVYHPSNPTYSGGSKSRSLPNSKPGQLLQPHRFRKTPT